MPRSIWSGAISFGLVNVPVKLYSAVSRKTVRFNQLNKETGNRIQQKRVDPETGEEVGYDQIVKGYELTKDRYVVITPEELDALDPERTRTIDIEDFVDLDEIDPVYYDHPYYLVPDKGATKAYGLLLGAMEQAGKVAIARVVMRSKEQLVAIRPSGDVLMMETMLFHDEVVPPDDIDDLPEGKELKASDRELKMAQQLIDSLSSEFEPERYRDEYREKVLELIERKASGEEIAVQPEAPQPAKVPGPDGGAGGEPRGRQGQRTATAKSAQHEEASKSGSKSKAKEKAKRLARLGVHLEPHARPRGVVDAPAVRELLDEHEAPAGRAQRVARRLADLEAAAGVVDLDPQDAGGQRDRRAGPPRRRRGGPRWSPARRPAGGRRAAGRPARRSRSRPARRAPGRGRRACSAARGRCSWPTRRRRATPGSPRSAGARPCG